MPELPEVENVRRTLENLVTGKTIEDIIVTYPKIVKRPDDAEIFKEMLKGETIENIKRRGKFLLLYVTNYVIVSHLRMEGKFYCIKRMSQLISIRTSVSYLQMELNYIIKM